MLDKFKVICNKCGSQNVDISEESQYDNDENVIGSCYEMVCLDCGEREVIM